MRRAADFKGSDLGDQTLSLFDDSLFRYFSTSKAFVMYYLSGGMDKVSECVVKRMAADHFEEFGDPQGARRKAMAKLYKRAPDLPRQQAEKVKCNLKDVRQILHKQMHRVNWLRKKHGDIVGFDDVITEE